MKSLDTPHSSRAVLERSVLYWRVSGFAGAWPGSSFVWLVASVS